MLGGSRIDRVNELVRQELSELMLRVLELPLGTLVTITRVSCSPDLEHAKVWVSILPTDETEEVMKRLEGALGELQYQLVRKLSMEPIPKIRWILDETETQAERIETILDSLDDPK